MFLECGGVSILAECGLTTVVLSNASVQLQALPFDMPACGVE